MSCTRPVTASHIWQVHCGVAYEALLQTRLFDPLNMSSAGIGPQGAPDSRGAIDEGSVRAVPWGHGEQSGSNPNPNIKSNPSPSPSPIRTCNGNPNHNRNLNPNPNPQSFSPNRNANRNPNLHRSSNK